MPNTATIHKNDSVASEASELIQRMYHHIVNDNCEHCKDILKSEAGNQPAPDAAHIKQHNSAAKLSGECYNE